MFAEHREKNKDVNESIHEQIIKLKDNPFRYRLFFLSALSKTFVGKFSRKRKKKLLRSLSQDILVDARRASLTT